jgi:hypothetical protein
LGADAFPQRSGTEREFQFTTIVVGAFQRTSEMLGTRISLRYDDASRAARAEATR